MPAEPTQAKLKRRASRSSKDIPDEGHGRFDAGHSRELEMKRNRGTFIFMDRACGPLTDGLLGERRGCAALCPNGSLSTGQGTRFVLAATEHLHRRIGALSARIRLLEDALTSLQASHPLLHPDLVACVDDDMDDDIERNGGRGGGGGDVIDAFGTLSISDHGISRFFGPTGGVESLLISNLTPNHGPSSSSSPPHVSPTPSPHNPTSSPLSTTTASSAPDPLSLFSSSFPFTPLGNPLGVQSLVASHLPTRTAADKLVQTYLQQCSWIFHGVTRAQLVDEMIPAVYLWLEQRRRSEHLDEYGVGDEGGVEVGSDGDYSGPHDLALLFIIFAIGALVRTQPQISDLNSSSPHCQFTSPRNPPASSPLSTTSTAASSHLTSTNNALGEHYYQLSRAALALQPVLEKPSLVTIQVLHLMSIYNAMSGSDLRSETSMEMTWSLVTLAGHLSMTIGLHRDSARWGLTPKMVQRRRILFWDLFVADVWQSLNTGRPPSFSLAYIDCSFPDAKDAVDGEGAEAGFGSAFSTWQCRFAAECVADVTSRTLTAEAPTYATIMELDKKVREFPLPEGMASSGLNGRGRVSASGEEEAGVGDDTESEEINMAASFQRCVLDHIRETAIIEYPTNPLKSPYAPSFLAAYRAASTILKSVREQFGIWPNSCARFWTMWTFAFSAAPILKRLAEKARNALAAAQKDPASLSDVAEGVLWQMPTMKREQHDSDDELAIFAGHTRFVSSRKPNHDSMPSSTQPQAPQYQPSPPLSSINGWPGPAEYTISVSPTPGEKSAMLPLHYPYAPSERSTHSLRLDLDLEIFRPRLQPQHVWEEESPVTHVSMQGYSSHQQQGSISQMQMMGPPLPASRVAPSQPQPPPQRVFYTSSHPHPQHHPQPHPQETHPPQSAQHPHAVHPYAHVQQYQAHQPQQAYPQHPQPHVHILPQHHAQHQDLPQGYPQQQVAPTHLPGNAELADLGLAARDSRLDERWSSFMHESGILEDINALRER
ncbi:hypothetical protein H0H87_009784 [Tephrocybe sp. NHM501043]|nr:hypothetical protein H0H87_009784 [Tephrocybe sp. NHM501043]